MLCVCVLLLFLAIFFPVFPATAGQYLYEIVARVGGGGGLLVVSVISEYLDKRGFVGLVCGMVGTSGSIQTLWCLLG